MSHSPTEQIFKELEYNEFYTERNDVDKIAIKSFIEKVYSQGRADERKEVVEEALRYIISKDFLTDEQVKELSDTLINSLSK